VEESLEPEVLPRVVLSLFVSVFIFLPFIPLITGELVIELGLNFVLPFKYISSILDLSFANSSSSVSL
jgi:hypothetical protein